MVVLYANGHNMCSAQRASGDRQTVAIFGNDRFHPAPKTQQGRVAASPFGPDERIAADAPVGLVPGSHKLATAQFLLNQKFRQQGQAKTMGCRLRQSGELIESRARYDLRLRRIGC